jgi:hypothetical protein
MIASLSSSFRLAMLLLLVSVVPGKAQDIHFALGEPSARFMKRMDSIGMYPLYDTATNLVALRSDVWSAGLRDSFAVVTIDGAGRTESLTLFFDQPFDTIYAHYAKKLGPPVSEGYRPEEATYNVLFRDSAFDYVISDDSLVRIESHHGSLPSIRGWQKLFSDDVGAMFYDTNVSYNRYMPLKRVANTATANFFGTLKDSKFPGIGYANFGYSLISYEVDCTHQMIKARGRADYTHDDHFICYERKPDKDWWKPTQPGFLKAIERICR